MKDKIVLLVIVLILALAFYVSLNIEFFPSDVGKSLEIYHSPIRFVEM